MMPFIFKFVNNRLFLRVLVFFGVMLFCPSEALFAQNKEAAFQGNVSKSYEEAIESYKLLAEEHAEAHLIEVGMSDSGKALHCFVLSSENPLDQYGQFSLPENKAILFINNGIHPGEPCGIDASIQFAERILKQRNAERQEILEQLVIAIIPVYNVGGALNRNCCSRANQNGPEEYGFRGNAKNLDLNRDFIKLDSENARSLVYLLRELNPNVFIDTHTSNGADYQYVMTMIATQPDKASAPIGKYIREKMSPILYADMEKQGYGMTPYVYGLGRIPDEGIKDFLETPRYSTGYNALFNTIGYTSETHMLKPFAQRV
ncbi:MAG: M14 family zinc carboxypeptidase, partial [Flavobacteriales bacterium]|nr:M14 family zinc carboxypeptidase [Flavobacteriales bacterium]